MTSETPDSGFTLVELLLVVTIIGLAAAIVGPLMAESSRQLAGRAAAYEMLSLLRQARWYAADTGQSCLVRLEPTEGGYRWDVFRAAPGSEELTPVKADWAEPGLLAKIDGVMQIPPDRQLRAGGPMEVRLEPWGADADYVIDLGGSRPMRIEVRRPGGMVWLRDPQSEQLLDGRALSEAENYWQAHCSSLAP